MLLPWITALGDDHGDPGGQLGAQLTWGAVLGLAALGAGLVFVVRKLLTGKNERPFVFHSLCLDKLNKFGDL
jgi:hypothetical protein